MRSIIGGVFYKAPPEIRPVFHKINKFRNTLTAEILVRFIASGGIIPGCFVFSSWVFLMCSKTHAQGPRSSWKNNAGFRLSNSLGFRCVCCMCTKRGASRSQAPKAEGSDPRCQAALTGLLLGRIWAGMQEKACIAGDWFSKLCNAD